MHYLAPLSTRRWSILGLLGAALILLSGCDVSIKNLTPPTFSENPSQTYSITLQVTKKSGILVPSSVKPKIVIDGQIFPMVKSYLGEDIWEFDYRLPSGRQDGAYYFLVDYDVNRGNGLEKKDTYTQLYKFKVVNRYALTLDVNRAPVGARVSILGRGFTRSDSVLVGGVPATTEYESATSVSFAVPAVTPGQNHQVTLASGLDVGTLRVDPATIRVVPSSLSLASGSSAMLIFSIPTPAPFGGMPINVTTDIPDSVIMPEVVVPEGDRSVNISVQGGTPGQGTIYVTAPGQIEITVPIEVY